MRKLIALVLLPFVMVGCMVGPDYRRPAIDTPPAWRLTDQEAKDLANTAWWKQFNDPVLDDLVATALRENKDLLIAAARIEEFAGRYGIVRADLFPQVSAGASGDRQQVSKRGGNPPGDGYHSAFDTYQTAINATWEIDVWGRIRRSSESARAQLLASEEGRRTVILTLVSSVAASYTNLRDLDRQLEIAKNTALSRGESYKIFTERFTGGIISQLELSQVKSQYDEALATIPLFEKAILQQENALSVLLGRNPGPITRGRTIDQLTLPTVPAGLPSDLLQQRPDIRQAEENLIAANAQIGVAKAAYFPTITLTGIFGYSSAELSRLFTPTSVAWQYGGNAIAPIFTAGKIAGQVQAAEAVQKQAVIGYQQAVQNAFREVNDALIDQNRTREQLAAQGRQVESLREYADVARLRYDNGYTSYIEVLDAERSLFNAELQYTQTQEVLFLAMINLYKAMGGGWVDVADAQSELLPAAAFPCMTEIDTYCKDIPHGKGHILVCLEEHRQELSPACREKMETVRGKLEEAKMICTPDLEKFCAGVAPGQGRLLKCLKGAMDRLSPACREKVEYYGGKVAATQAPEKQGER